MQLPPTAAATGPPEAACLSDQIPTTTPMGSPASFGNGGRSASGIYYESLPEGPVRIALFRRLRGAFDEFMQPQAADRRALKVSEALDILDFLALAAQINSGQRPKSRQYLDWLTSMVDMPLMRPESSGLILP